MLSQFQSQESETSAPKSGSRTGPIIAVIITMVASLVGSILGLGFSALNRWDRAGTLAVIGASFGCADGLLISLVVISVQRLSNVRRASRLRIILVFATLGGACGALLLPIFGDGVAMAMYLAVEGGVAGIVIGSFVGLFIPRLRVNL